MFMFLILDTFGKAHWIFVKLSIFQKCGWKRKHRMNYQLQQKTIAKVVRLIKVSTLTKLDNLA
jgi:hypothetical protein